MERKENIVRPLFLPVYGRHLSTELTSVVEYLQCTRWVILKGRPRAQQHQHQWSHIRMHTLDILPIPLSRWGQEICFKKPCRCFWCATVRTTALDVKCRQYAGPWDINMDKIPVPDLLEYTVYWETDLYTGATKDPEGNNINAEPQKKPSLQLKRRVWKEFLK